MEGFEAGGGGAKNDGDVQELGAFDGDVPAVVSRLGVLLVGWFVLLVDDDESELGGGGEDGGARSDDDASLARGDA